MPEYKYVIARPCPTNRSSWARYGYVQPDSQDYTYDVDKARKFDTLEQAWSQAYTWETVIVIDVSGE